MSSTSGKDLVDLSSFEPETVEITNEMAKEPGFPAYTAEGELVNIVQKIAATGDAGVTFVADDGRRYQNAYNTPDALELIEEGDAPEIDEYRSQAPDEKVTGDPGLSAGNPAGLSTFEPQEEVEEPRDDQWPPAA